MATQSWSSRIRHDSDATFREWGSDFAAKLATVGLVQTADTGQINWATVTRPGANTWAGYEVWRMNDALQGTAPVFFKIEYGTGSQVTAPAIRFTVGTGSNGSGTLTGTALSAAARINGNSVQNTDTPRQSYMCATEGFFGFDWKVGSSNTEASFFFCRTVDSDGAPTATGALCYWGVGAPNNLAQVQAFRYAAPAAAYTAQTTITAGMLGFLAQARASTLVGADLQTALAFTITPRIEPLVGVCGVLDPEVSTGNTFSVAMVGITPRTYLACSTNAGPFGPASSAAAGFPKIAMLWE